MRRYSILISVLLAILLMTSIYMIPRPAKAQPRSDLDIYWYGSPDAAWTALINDEIDFIQWSLTEEQKAAAEENPDIQLASYAENGMFEFDFNNNCTIPSYPNATNPMYNETVRKAIAFLIDKQHIIANSIFLDNNNSDINGSDGVIITHLNNNYIDTSNVGIANFKSGNIFDGVNLGFVDVENGNYNLTASSDLIDAGTTEIEGLTLPDTDLNGNARIAGGNIDIGPYEFSTTRPTINSIKYTGDVKEFSELTFSVDYNLTDGRSLSSIEYDYENNGTWTASNYHTYEKAGTYTYAVKVTDSENEFSIKKQSITISELPFSEMTEEQKLKKAIDPQYYNEIISIIENREDSSYSSGVSTGENNVISDPHAYNLYNATDINASRDRGFSEGKQYVLDNLNEFNLIPKTDIVLTSEKIAAFNSGWTLTSTPLAITDLSIFDSVAIIWIYNNETASWSAYSSDSPMKEKIEQSGITLLTTIPAGSGIWVYK